MPSTAERAARAFLRGVEFFKIAAWTLFALLGPFAFLLMQNYLGVAISGAIGVAIGFFVFGPKRAAFAWRRDLRVALIAEGLLVGSYGAYKLALPAAPWAHVAGATRVSLGLADSGAVYAIEFTESSSRFLSRESEGGWSSERFPGHFVSEFFMNASGGLIVAPEDRSNAIWVRRSGHWHEQARRGGAVRFAPISTDLFMVQDGKLFRVDSEDLTPDRFFPVGPVTVVCSAGSTVLAAERTGPAWLSTDEGAAFRSIPTPAFSPALCGVSKDGTAWLAAPGVFSGDLAVAPPSGQFAPKRPPGPRIEALTVNPGDGKQAWIGIWGGGVYRSGDGGQSWEPMGLLGSEVSALVVDFRRKTAYAGTGSGVLRRSFE
jgi:hypothetical protein